MTDLVVEELLTAALGLSAPQVLALRLGAALVAEVLKHPQTTTGADSSVLSSTPGRVRVAAEGLKGSDRLARRIEERLGQLPGVERVSASPLTGTVLVTFDPTRLETDAIARAVRLSGMALRVLPPDLEYGIASVRASRSLAAAR